MAKFQNLVLKFHRVQPGSHGRKNRGFSPSGVCEGILTTLKYGTNIRLLLQRYRIYSVTTARRMKPSPILTTSVNKALATVVGLLKYDKFGSKFILIKIKLT